MTNDKEQVVSDALKEYKKMFPKDYLEKFAHDLGAISIVSENGFDQLITAYLFTVDDYKLCVEDMKKTTEGMVRFLYVMKKTGNIIENAINNWVVAEE